MSGIVTRLRNYLEENQIPYEVLRHRRDVRAVETAADTRTPEHEFAKTLFVAIDGKPAMAVLPASHSLAESRLARALDARDVQLASESQFQALCPDCEVGAAPPFGNLYNLPVYVSPALSKDEYVTFNAGSHEEAVRMSYADYERLVQPRIVHMARHE